MHECVRKSIGGRGNGRGKKEARQIGRNEGKKRKERKELWKEHIDTWNRETTEIVRNTDRIMHLQKWVVAITLNKEKNEFLYVVVDHRYKFSF